MAPSWKIAKSSVVYIWILLIQITKLGNVRTVDIHVHTYMYICHTQLPIMGNKHSRSSDNMALS